MLTAEQAKIRFERTMTLLRDADAAFTADAIYSLSDLDGDQLDHLPRRLAGPIRSNAAAT